MSSKRRLCINGRFLLQTTSGMQRYARELVCALDRCLGDSKNELAQAFSDVVLLVPTGRWAEPMSLQRIKVSTIGRWQGHLWEQTELAWHSRHDVLLSLVTSAPLLHRRSVLALHDAAVFVYPENFSFAYRTWHRWLRPLVARRSVALITISEFSRRELSRYCGVPEAEFTIIGDSAEHILKVNPDFSVLEKWGLERGRFVLAVGNQAPNKNIRLAVEAFAGLSFQDWKMAVAGGQQSKIFAGEVPEGNANVKFLGRVTDEELSALYRSAALFVFPSRYEGFGVPPLEAMALGCPVLSSDAASMPEILSDAAEYFSSESVDDLAQGMRRVLSSPEARSRMIESGKMRAELFSWDDHVRVLIGKVFRIKS